MQAEEIECVTLTLPSGEQIEQVIIREESGLFFCVDASYVEQDVAPIHSPYGNGVVQLPEPGWHLSHSPRNKGLE